MIDPQPLKLELVEYNADLLWSDIVDSYVLQGKESLANNVEVSLMNTLSGESSSHLDSVLVSLLQLAEGDADLGRPPDLGQVRKNILARAQEAKRMRKVTVFQGKV